MSENFSFVIVGSGSISSTYASAIARVEGASVAAVVSRRARLPAALEAPVPVVSSPEDVPVPYDAVVLATPNGTHHLGAVEAAKLGKHVLTEKVLDISTESMDAMTEACRAGGVKLGVCYQKRMSPDNRVVKQLLDEGALGKVFAVDLAVKYFRDQAYYDSAPYRGGFEIDGGGPFMQQAAHNVDIYCWFFGMPQKVASVLGTFVHRMEAEDHGVALMRHATGMVGTITASTAARPGFPGRLEIHAEKGTVILENDAITEWGVEGMENPSCMGDFKAHDATSTAKVDDTSGHEAIIKDFIEAVRQDREPAVPPQSARMATELILWIYRAQL